MLKLKIGEAPLLITKFKKGTPCIIGECVRMRIECTWLTVLEVNGSWTALLLVVCRYCKKHASPSVEISTPQTLAQP